MVPGPSGFAVAHVYLQQWNLPAGANASPFNVFSPKRETQDSVGKFRAGSGECFAVFPILRAWLQRSVPPGVLALERVSFLALCTVIDGFLALRAGLFSEGDIDVWEERILRHINCFKAAYPDTVTADGTTPQTKPKHHYAMHVAAVHRRFKLTQCAFVCERKHRDFKRTATQISINDHYEIAVLRQLTLCAQKAAEAGLRLGELLHNEKRKRNGDEEVFVGNRASYHGIHLASCDFIMYWNADNERVGVVRGFTRAGGGGTVCATVSPYTLIDGEIDVYEPTGGEPDKIELRYIIAACIWCQRGEAYHVLKPGELEWMHAAT